MQLKRLELTQFRIFEQATFDFQPGLNLLVGINGAGKTSVLDALCILLSQVLRKVSSSRSKPQSFQVDDITIGRTSVTAEVHFDALGASYSQLMHQPREEYTAEKEREGEVRGQAEKSVKRNQLTLHRDNVPTPSPQSASEQPLAVYFSTRRAVPSSKAPSKQSSAGGQFSAFADSLTHRELRLREFAEWWLAQEALAQENADSLSARRLKILNDAATRFLDQYSHLRAVHQSTPTLLLDKDDITLDVRQLSDGERGILSLVFDLARRLSQANPELEDPLRDGKAVVLIDELDLHLHPGWQRTVVENLTRTFSNCQFIATTHSPQIVGEVSPDNIILLESGQPPYRPDQSLGMDSNWILRFLMGTDERDRETDQELSRIADLIENEQYDEATSAIETLRSDLGEFPDLIRLLTRIDRIRLLGE